MCILLFGVVLSSYSSKVAKKNREVPNLMRSTICVFMKSERVAIGSCSTFLCRGWRPDLDLTVSTGIRRESKKYFETGFRPILLNAGASTVKTVINCFAFDMDQCDSFTCNTVNETVLFCLYACSTVTCYTAFAVIKQGPSRACWLDSPTPQSKSIRNSVTVATTKKQGHIPKMCSL